MSNALVASNLPAHLAALANNSALASLNADAVKGISSGSWPRISIKGSRFRLQDPQGAEVVVPEFFLDVVLVGVNSHGLSKIWYSGAYDPAGDGTAPDCYSDNGVAPSVRATKPQCNTCAACPHNVWGSKVTPSGAQVKACADVKKVAVLLASNTGGPVFELRIPAASLTNLGAYVRGLDAAGIPAASIITRLQFDTASDYPKLLFGTPVLQEGQSPYITQEMFADVMEVVGSDEVKQATGENDKPRAVTPGGAATGPALASALSDPNAYGPARAPLSTLPPPPPPPAAPHVSGPPLHPSQVGPTPPPNPAYPHAGMRPADPQPQPEPPAKRTRTRKASTAPLAGPPVQGTFAMPPQPHAAAEAPPPFIRNYQPGRASQHWPGRFGAGKCGSDGFPHG
jgi:hypothetical protein